MSPIQDEKDRRQGGPRKGETHDPFVIQHLLPFRTYLSPSLVARVLMLATSLPAPGSETPETNGATAGVSAFDPSAQNVIEASPFLSPETGRTTTIQGAGTSRRLDYAPYAHMRGSSVSRPRYLRFWSSLPARMTGAEARPFASMAVSP